MDDDKISNNPSASEMRKQMEGLQALRKIAPVLEGIGLGALTKPFDQTDDLVSQFQNLSTLPDRFNEHFGEMGWVASESSNVPIMEKAIALADEGKMDEAEAALIEYFNEENLRHMLNRMKGIQAWKIRINLAEKAMEDHLAGRFHASVSVVLSLMDGLVNDLEPTGLFAEQTDLTAWDSIAGHSTGLTALAALFCKGRMRTTDETITLPYRNGILHGRDLGYDNKMVSTKVWAALFVVADWARLVQAGKKLEPEEKDKEPTWREIAAGLIKNKKTKELLDAWKPRNITVGVDYPPTGEPSEYEEGSPERTFAEFIQFWKRKNFGNMASMLKDFGKKSFGQKAGETREQYGDVNVKDFEIVNIEDTAAAITVIKARICHARDNQDRWKEVEVRMICTDREGEPSIRWEENAEWRVLGMSLTPVLYDYDPS